MILFISLQQVWAQIGHHPASLEQHTNDDIPSTVVIEKFLLVKIGSEPTQYILGFKLKLDKLRNF
jgi:hypothetical protein